MQEEILEAKHIVITLDDNPSVDYIASANALYSYLLTLHKKVSIYCNSYEHRLNLDFLPWINKIKNSYPNSADFEFKAKSSLEVIDYFIENKIKLNAKMSTSLYAGILDATNGFLKGINGIIFAKAEMLVNNGADVLVCNINILNYTSLASLRLKAILLSKMRLEENAKTAVFYLEDEDLQKTGATVEESLYVLNDALALPTVKVVKIVYKEEEIIKKEI